MVAFLMGLQGGFTKFPCYVCFWDSRDTKGTTKGTTKGRNGHNGGRNNIKWKPLVHTWKVLMPPLQNKFGLMKQLVTDVDKESGAHKYLQDFFPKLSDAKIKANVFVRSQIKSQKQSLGRITARFYNFEELCLKQK